MREQLPRPLAVAQFGERHGGPDRGMRVLAAVFAHAGHVALDVAGVHRRTCRTADRAAGSVRRRGAPGAGRAIPCACWRRSGAPHAGKHRPALRRWSRSGIRRCRRSPAACRRRTRRGDTRRRPTRSAPVRCCSLSTSLFAASRQSRGRRAARNLGEAGRAPRQEESQPHAFASPAFADAVHAVVPVAGADQRQAVLAERSKLCLIARTQC